MKVKVNSKKTILKSFIGWLPLMLFSALFYGAILFLATLTLFNAFTEIDNELATQLSYAMSALLVVIGTYFYLKGISNSLSSYKLSIQNGSISIKGRSGWKTVNTEIPLNKIQKISLGKSSNIVEKIAFFPNIGSRQIKDQVASRLTFFLEEEKPIKLDFATKAFDGESLYDFFVHLNDQGIKTNVTN
jgi:hypothetical protein